MEAVVALIGSQDWVNLSEEHRFKLLDHLMNIFTFPFYSEWHANHRVKDLLQLFSSEASAQSMTWLHQAELGTQLPSLHDDSDEPHVISGRSKLAFQKDR